MVYSCFENCHFGAGAGVGRDGGFGGEEDGEVGGGGDGGVFGGCW